eukprot:COSAG02_NODE_6089_length_3811_cov_79.446803_4_plen_101_part_00
MAEYVASNLQQVWHSTSGQRSSFPTDGPARRLPEPLFAEAAASSRRPSLILDFAQDNAFTSTLPVCRPPEAPIGCGPPGKALVGGEFVSLTLTHVSCNNG